MVHGLRPAARSLAVPAGDEHDTAAVRAQLFRQINPVHVAFDANVQQRQGRPLGRGRGERFLRWADRMLRERMEERRADLSTALGELQRASDHHQPADPEGTALHGCFHPRGAERHLAPDPEAAGLGLVKAIARQANGSVSLTAKGRHGVRAGLSGIMRPELVGRGRRGRSPIPPLARARPPVRRARRGRDPRAWRRRAPRRRGPARDPARPVPPAGRWTGCRG